MTSDHCRVTVQRLFQNSPKLLETSKNVVWQSADGRVTSDHCSVTVQRLFSKFPQIAWNVQKTLFDSRPTVAWPPTTVAWPFSDDFFEKILIAWNVEKSLFDSQPTVAWPPTTVAWPFSDFFQNFRKSLETYRKRCLTVDRRSRNLRLLSRDRSVTFFKKFPNCLKRPKNVVWQSADGRVTSTTVAWPFSDFYQNFPKSLETSKKRCLTVGRRSRDSDHCRVTVQRLFSKFSQIARNVQKRCLTVSRRSRDLRPLSRDRSATFFEIFPNRLKRPRNVVWQSSDGRVTSDHCRVTVQRLFSKTFIIAWNVQKTLFDSRPTVAWPPTTVAWPFSDFFKILPNCLKRRKNVVWQSADGRVTSDHCSVTVQRLFSKFSQIAWNVQKTLFDSRPTVAWPPTTVAWPFSDFKKKKF